MRAFFKVFEIAPDGLPRTLFHSHNGTRRLAPEFQYCAGERLVSSGGPRFKEGFHAFSTLDALYKWSHSSKKMGRVVAVVHSEHYRPKYDIERGVFLLDDLWIDKACWELAVPLTQVIKQMERK